MPCPFFFLQQMHELLRRKEIWQKPAFGLHGQAQFVAYWKSFWFCFSKCWEPSCHNMFLSWGFQWDPVLLCSEILQKCPQTTVSLNPLGSPVCNQQKECRCWLHCHRLYAILNSIALIWSQGHCVATYNSLVLASGLRGGLKPQNTVMSDGNK